jgi:hypothetical protein
VSHDAIRSFRSLLNSPLSMQTRYFSFLLRLWQVKQNGGRSWHASLEDPHTGERHGFTNLEMMMKFLIEQTQIGEDEKKNAQTLEGGKI